MDARNIVDEESHVIAVDLRHDDVLRASRRLSAHDAEATRQIDERHSPAAQGEKPVDVRMRLRHRRHGKVRSLDDLAHLRDVDAVIDSADVELDDFKLICAGFQQNALLLVFSFCHEKSAPYFILHKTQFVKKV